ncbi:zinc finger protein 11-like [Mytilus californianus]|uniref:zinc finger protein 11-like n=1 Tax=Mytilus californianus TaxID=6549 RepID=UPI002245F285|nr:zinc finger protein 11-like [Mytilus californianus]
MEGSLTIPSHIEDLTKCMYELQQDGKFCDAGLECKDGVIFVHKLVLMACRSPYLRNQLVSESEGERVYVSLKNYSLKTVCCLVQTLYTGQINISQENEVDFSRLCEMIGLDKIKSAAENLIQHDQNIYEIESINPFCAVQVEEEVIESQDEITALVASVNHGPDDNLVDSTNTVDNVEDLNYDSSDVKVGSDMVKRSQDSEGEREADKSFDPPTMPTRRETRSNKRRKIFHNENTSQAKDNATSSNVAEILTIARQLSGIDEAQPTKPASSCRDQTKSSLCSLCTKEFVNEDENVTDPSKKVCTECMVLFSGETNDDQEVGTEPDQIQSYNSEDGGEHNKQDSVDLEEECLKKTCEEGSPLLGLIALEESDCDPLPWLQEQIVIDGCEKNEISDRKLRNKSQSDKGEIESGETNQEKLWHCKKCEFSTGDKKEQERHRKHHSYLKRKLKMSKLCKPPKYFCDECGNEYKTEVGLIQHKKLSHSDKPILSCVLRGCKSRFVEESALQKHLLWHKSQGVLKCRKCAQVFVLKGALKRHEDYCVKRLMFRCDICNKVYKAQRNLSEHMSKMHCEGGKGFNYRESLKFSRNINSLTSGVEQNKRASLTVENTSLETTMEEFNADNVEEFVAGMNSILLTQQNEKKTRQTHDVYRCIQCEFSTVDKTQYTKHRKHHDYLKLKQKLKSAEPQSQTCGKCETEHKATLDLKVHTEKVHSLVFECLEKGCFKYFSDEHKLNEHLIEHAETVLIKCGKCAKSFVTKHDLNKHDVICIPNRTVQRDTAHENDENGDDVVDNDDMDDDDGDDGDDDDDNDDDIEGIVKTLNKAINKKRKSKVYKCEKCNFSTKDHKDYEKHTRRHRYLNWKETQIHICRYCGLTFRTISGMTKHELTFHSDQFYKCKVKSCTSVFKYKQQLEKHILKHKERGLLKCKKCNKKFVFKYKLTPHEDKCIRNMTANEQTQCHLCGKQVGSKSGLLKHMRKHYDGMFHCFCGKTFDSIKNLNQHKKIHHDPMLKPFCEKEVSEESDDSIDSDSDEMENSTSLSSSA